MFVSSPASFVANRSCQKIVQLQLAASLREYYLSYPRCCSRKLSSLNDPLPGVNEQKPRRRSHFFRKALFYTLISAGAFAGALYTSEFVRDELVKYYPDAKTVLQTTERLVGGWYTFSKKSPEVDKQEEGHNLLPFATQQPSFTLPRHDPETKATLSESSVPESASTPPLPTFEELRQAKEAQIDTIVVPTDIRQAIKDASNAVHSAQTSLGQLKIDTEKYRAALKESFSLSEQDPSKQKILKQAAKLEDAKNRAQNKADVVITKARGQLDALRTALDHRKTSDTNLVDELIPEAINVYGQLNYDLSEAIHEVRKVQNDITTTIKYRDLLSSTNKNLQEELESAMSGLDLSTSSKDSSSMSVEELNTVIAMAHKKIAVLNDHLASAREREKGRIASALENQRAGDEALKTEAIQQALELERSRTELERHKWAIKAREDNEIALRLALARHSDHLAQMLRSKEEEMERHFTYRLRDALIQERVAFEAGLSGWTKRMHAIEDVVEGRAELDRLAKEAQSLWLACESFACSLRPVTPTSTMGKGLSVFDSAHVARQTGPLRNIIEAVREVVSMGQHTFVLTLLEELPQEVVERGVWTEQGLKQRFEKVYKVCRRVALIDETSASLWMYALSWLQSVLMLDVVGRKCLALASRINPEKMSKAGLSVDKVSAGDSSYQAVDTFYLLSNAKAALESSDALLGIQDDTSPPIDVDDGIELAVKLLGQLKGQPAVVASDWLRDARLYLEAKQTARALLAHAAARNIASFQKRL